MLVLTMAALPRHLPPAIGFHLLDKIPDFDCQNLTIIEQLDYYKRSFEVSGVKTAAFLTD
jgi:hypothetical protein